MDQIDLLIRAAGASVFGLTAALWLRRAPLDRTAWLFALAALGAVGFLAGNAADPALRLDGALRTAAHLLSGWAAVFVWWFLLRLFGADGLADRRVRAASLAWMAYAAAERGLLGARLEALPSWPLILGGIGLLGHLVLTLVRERDGDLIEPRRALRLVVAWGLGGLLAADLLIDLVLGTGWRPGALSLVQNTALLALAAILADAVLTARSPFAAGPARLPASDPDAALLARLDALLAEGVHRDPALTIAGLARRLAASEARTRRLINHRLGHGHFRTFLNTHRVATARTLLADPHRQGETIASLAFESGFASLASFNRAFRSVTGTTPTAYRREALGAPASPASEELPRGC